MEPNGGLFSGMGSGMLGLEMPLHQTQNPQNPQHHHHMHQSQMVSYDHTHHQQQAQPSVKHGYPFPTKPKQFTLSDEDEPGPAGDDSTGDNQRKISPWQRMKWTDTMVRLLIMAVFYIGDEGVSEGSDPTGKKKNAGGLLQKKGKWKSVSRAMMEKGFCVSPQQCEDKFNDLNKRYKRVNDILGKGTACKVVENHGLLEKMELSAKMKDEVRKLLNSKHLFFREMCAYHNSCGHGTVGAAGASGGAAHNSSPEMGTDPSEVQLQQQQQPALPQQQRCLHLSENAHVVANSGRSETEASKMLKADSGDDDYDDDDDDDDEGVVEGGPRGQIEHVHEDEDENDHERAKRPRKGSYFSGFSTKLVVQQLSNEVTAVIQDVSKSPWEKKQWMKTRLIQLEEQQLSYQYQSFELEKQRLKWIKYSSKKKREMETVKLENERRRLENERMLLLLRKKELELLDLQQQQQQNSSNKRTDPSSLTG